jgi:hypothetical protein
MFVNVAVRYRDDMRKTTDIPWIVGGFEVCVEIECP